MFKMLSFTTYETKNHRNLRLISVVTASFNSKNIRFTKFHKASFKVMRCVIFRFTSAPSAVASQRRKFIDD